VVSQNTYVLKGVRPGAIHMEGTNKRTETHLPLPRKVTITSGNTEKKRIEGSKLMRIDIFVIKILRGVHLIKDIFRQGLRDSIVKPVTNRSLHGMTVRTGRFQPFLLRSLCQPSQLQRLLIRDNEYKSGTLGYMAVHRIYYDGNFWSRHVVDGLFFVVDAERNWVPLSKEF